MRGRSKPAAVALIRPLARLRYDDWTSATETTEIRIAGASDAVPDGKARAHTSDFRLLGGYVSQTRKGAFPC
jgi:hypothetical protein